MGVAGAGQPQVPRSTAPSAPGEPAPCLYRRVDGDLPAPSMVSGLLSTGTGPDPRRNAEDRAPGPASSVWKGLSPGTLGRRRQHGGLGSVARWRDGPLWPQVGLPIPSSDWEAARWRPKPNDDERAPPGGAQRSSMGACRLACLAQLFAADAAKASIRQTKITSSKP